MLNIDCDAAYADVMERALYNGALSGLSRDGAHYYYENPLESAGDHHRWAWHHCPCCPMNVARLIGSVGGYFYSVGDDVLAVHLYGENTAELEVGDLTVGIRQETDYPWSGDVMLVVEPERAALFALRLRIPDGRRPARLLVNGENADFDMSRGYAVIRRTWTAGDTVSLDLEMPVERLYAHPAVRMDIGRVCIKRGPLIYTMESADNPDLTPARLRLPQDARIEPVKRDDLFDGIVTLVAEASAASADDWDGDLYRTEPPQWRPATVELLPYYLWDNRTPGEMLVWLAEA
jgi:DUF1680 family protein